MPAIVDAALGCARPLLDEGWAVLDAMIVRSAQISAGAKTNALNKLT
jgi:hypothetical protein